MEEARSSFIYYLGSCVQNFAHSIVFLCISCFIHCWSRHKAICIPAIRFISLPDLCLILHLPFGWSGALAAQLELWGVSGVSVFCPLLFITFSFVWHHQGRVLQQDVCSLWANRLKSKVSLRLSSNWRGGWLRELSDTLAHTHASTMTRMTNISHF